MPSTPQSMRLPYQPRCCWTAPLTWEASIYGPLDEAHLRLLRLDDFNDEGVLRCSLHTMARGEALDYSAISYTWNEASRVWYGAYDISPKPIEINGKLVRVSDKIGNILCLALQQHGKTFVWLDAICINQSDIEERGHQVSKMGEIYSGATDVLCFVNNPTAKTDQMLDTINRYADMPTETWPLWLFRVNFYPLLADDYWSRAWTLQEMILAKPAIMCYGRQTVRLFKAAEFEKNLNEGADERLQGLQKIPLYLKAAFDLLRMAADLLLRGKNVTMLSRSWQISQDAEFLDVMRECRFSRGCTDPRDLIYSRLALCSTSYQFVPSPNYTISVAELYKEVAANHILVTRSLEIITCATRTSRQLPSWVPDWTTVNDDWKLDPVIPSIDWQKSDLPQISPCRSELMVQGKVLDVVRESHWIDSILYRLVGFTAFGEAYTLSEAPRPGDMICILRECPSLVYLRAMGTFHTIVVRNRFARRISNRWRRPVLEEALKALLSADALPEVIFKIR